MQILQKKKKKKKYIYKYYVYLEKHFKKYIFYKNDSFL